MRSSALRVANIVFKRAKRSDVEKFAIDSRMLAVWMEIDGRQTLGSVAEKLGVKISAIKPTVSELLRLGLIEPKRNAEPHVLDSDFIDTLIREYSLAVGPIAGVLIEDEALSLGHAISQFPVHRIAELIDILAREIQREAKTMAFKQKMLSKIREKGY